MLNSSLRLAAKSNPPSLRAYFWQIATECLQFPDIFRRICNRAIVKIRRPPLASSHSKHQTNEISAAKRAVRETSGTKDFVRFNLWTRESARDPQEGSARCVNFKWICDRFQARSSRYESVRRTFRNLPGSCSDGMRPRERPPSRSPQASPRPPSRTSSRMSSPMPSPMPSRQADAKPDAKPDDKADIRQA